MMMSMDPGGILLNTSLAAECLRVAAIQTNVLCLIQIVPQLWKTVALFHINWTVLLTQEGAHDGVGLSHRLSAL